MLNLIQRRIQDLQLGKGIGENALFKFEFTFYVQSEMQETVRKCNSFISILYIALWSWHIRTKEENAQDPRKSPEECDGSGI